MIRLIIFLFLVSCSYSTSKERDRIKFIKKLGGSLETAHCIEKERFIVVEGKEYFEYIQKNLCIPKYNHRCSKDKNITMKELVQAMENKCGSIVLLSFYVNAFGLQNKPILRFNKYELNPLNYWDNIITRL